MVELYRLVSGSLYFEEQSNEFNFGFIYDDDGKLKIEIYIQVKEGSILANHWLKNNPQSFQDKLRIVGLTVRGEKVTLLNLFPTNFSTSNPSIAKFNCLDRLIYERPLLDGQKTNSEKDTEKIYDIELEGLRIEHTEITEKKTYRANSCRDPDEDFLNFERNHTTIKVNLLHDKFPYITYDGEFYNHPEPGNPNIVLRFSDFVTSDVFDLNKEYLVKFLSFINGGDVRIRKIYRGFFHTISENKIDAQIVETYSFNKFNNEIVSDYVPISNTLHSNKRVLAASLFQYQQFIKEDKDLDFGSTIFYLNRAINNDNIEQKVFTLMIGLEELGSKLRQLFPERVKTIMAIQDFEPIKKELKRTLKSFKSQIPNEKNQYNILLNKLCDINIQKQSTNDKFIELFDYCKIELTTEIEKLITQRNLVIHEGNIGEEVKERWSLYYELDHLLRDIILNRIGYKGVRRKHFMMNKISK